MNEEQVKELTAMFAKRTQEGWAVPTWLAALRAEHNLPEMPTFNAIDWEHEIQVEKQLEKAGWK